MANCQMLFFVAFSFEPTWDIVRMVYKCNTREAFALWFHDMAPMELLAMAIYEAQPSAVAVHACIMLPANRALSGRFGLVCFVGAALPILDLLSSLLSPGCISREVPSPPPLAPPSSLLVLGLAGSGKTTLIRSVVAVLAGR